MTSVGDFTDAGFFVLRAPLLAYEQFGVWTSALAEQATDVGTRTRSEQRGHDLRAVETAITDPIVQEALQLASHDLYREVRRCLDTGERPSSRTLAACGRYLLRMSGRSTPYGLCAAVSTGRVAMETRLHVDGISDAYCHARPDAAWVLHVAHSSRGPAAGSQDATYYPNPTLYKALGRWRYMRHDVRDGTVRFALASVDRSIALTRILRRARRGSTFSDLVQSIADLADAAEAAVFVSEAIDAEILLGPCDLSATGAEPHVQLGAALHELPSRDDVPGFVSAIETCQLIRRAKPGENRQRLTESVLPAGAARDWHRDAPGVQVDLFRAGTPTLGRGAVGALLEGAHAIAALRRALSRDPLAAFKAAFRARYEGATVPLTTVLDDDVGIGLGLERELADPGPLLAKVNLHQNAGGTDTWNSAYTRVLAALLQRAARDKVVQITDQDLGSVHSPNVDPLPNAFSVVGTIMRGHGRESAAIKYVSAPSGLSMLARFSHGAPELADHLREYARKEEALDPEPVYAEVNFLPPGRLGNVVCRPSLRRWDIVLLSSLGSVENHAIPLNDLMLSLVGDELVLSSRSLRRRVVPRIASMHVASSEDQFPAYRFLALLEMQGREGLRGGFDWGPYWMLPHLPRVVYKNAVLALERWRVRLPPAGPRPAAESAGCSAAIGELRSTYELPRFVHLSNGRDNDLPLDLDEPFCQEVLYRELRGADSSVLLYEMPAEPRAALACGASGHYANEVVVPFLRKARAPARTRVAPDPTSNAVARVVYVPGSEWIFCKMYCSRDAADDVITRVVGPIVDSAHETERDFKWFFIRYQDPEYHIRFRMRVRADDAREALTKELQSRLGQLLRTGLIHRVEFATYIREVGRYGGRDASDAADVLFCADSNFVLRLLRSADVPHSERPWVAIAGIARYLDDWSIPLAHRPELLDAWRAGYGRSARDDKGRRMQLAQLFRESEDELTGILRDGGPEEWRVLLSSRSAAGVRAVEQYHHLSRDGRLTQPTDAILGSILHMSLNRLLARFPNEHEQLAYDFLWRYYRSVLGRTPRTG